QQDISVDGSCGPDSYTRCPDNYCCSQWGYCGNTPDFCDLDQGCQPDYGICGQISNDGTCGPDWGYCGSTSEFCDPNQGCQSGYGFCGLSNDTNPDDGIQVIDTCQNPYTLALTFDDGPRSWTNDLLDKLDEYDIKATFFVNGHNENDYCIYDFAEILQRAYSS
ncbi:29321_t:CDS:2, partial [Racocetra persica]